MKNLIVILCIFLHTFGYSQFSFDKVIFESFSMDSKYEKSEIASKGEIIFNQDTTSVDIILNGVKQTMKLRYVTGGYITSSYGFYRYNIDDTFTEDLIIYVHKGKTYGVEIYQKIGNPMPEYTRIKYTITKW